MSDETRAALRGATYRGDGEEVLAASRRVDVELALQLGGGGALAALSQGRNWPRNFVPPLEWLRRSRSSRSRSTSRSCRACWKMTVYAASVEHVHGSLIPATDRKCTGDSGCLGHTSPS